MMMFQGETKMLTQIEQDKIREFLIGKHIPSGLGSEREACSIASINLALTGELSDRIPDCMSPVIGRWIIGVQDAMPDAMRNSREWRELLPFAAGTGRLREEARSAILLNWVWDIVLPQIQSVADSLNFGAEWKAMTTEKTAAAAGRAAAAAGRAAAAAGRAAAAAARAVAVAAEAAAARAAVEAAAEAVEAAAEAAEAAARAAAWVAEAAAWVAEAARLAAEAAFWTTVNPIEILRQLIDAGKDA
jgi:hypothetical protein